jgi:hypothetical protein
MFHKMLSWFMQKTNEFFKQEPVHTNYFMLNAEGATLNAKSRISGFPQLFG